MVDNNLPIFSEIRLALGTHQDRSKNYSAENTLNADERAIFGNDQGRLTFSARDHVGMQMNCEKQQVTGWLKIDAEGTIPVRQAIVATLDACTIAVIKNQFEKWLNRWNCYGYMQ